MRMLLARTARRREEHAEAAVGVTHEVRAIAHELEDVAGIAQEVLTACRGALPVAAPVRHQQAEALIGERPLRLPLVGADGERAVHEHDARALAPGVYEEVARRHSITRSARSSAGCGMVRPTAFAVFTLISSSPNVR